MDNQITLQQFETYGRLKLSFVVVDGREVVSDNQYRFVLGNLYKSDTQGKIYKIHNPDLTFTMKLASIKGLNIETLRFMVNDIKHEYAGYYYRIYHQIDTDYMCVDGQYVVIAKYQGKQELSKVKYEIPRQSEELYGKIEELKKQLEELQSLI